MPSSKQASLFDVTIKSPFCIYAAHCGARAQLGAVTVGVGHINQAVACLTCAAHGEISENTEPQPHSS